MKIKWGKFKILWKKDLKSPDKLANLPQKTLVEQIYGQNQLPYIGLRNAAKLIIE